VCVDAGIRWRTLGVSAPPASAVTRRERRTEGVLKLGVGGIILLHSCSCFWMRPILGSAGTCLELKTVGRGGMLHQTAALLGSRHYR
jgi:hypothetical protein